MNIVVFDTETTSIEKPFVYDIGYTIWNVETMTVLLKRSYVVEQTWHNRELFCTAYYADKREGYIARMKGKTAIMDKIGHITQQMVRDFAYYEVEGAYAYNSPFDDGVFKFNCEWYKIKNPFDTIPIFDIRGYVHQFIAFTPDFQQFCEDNERFTESGNYSTTAETLFQYIAGDTDFEEEHTALADSEIELAVLLYCINKGAQWNKEYKVYRSVPRKVDKVCEIKTADGEIVEFPYNTATVYKEKNKKMRIILKKRVDK
jgi:hypothetical protein